MNSGSGSAQWWRRQSTMDMANIVNNDSSGAANM